VHVFAYGSLAAARPDAASELHGFRRCWGVAMDNRETIPGYKVYVDEHGDRPPVQVAFLDLEPHPGGVVTGALVPVDEVALARLDVRERNYERVEVRPGVWAYAGLPEARRRLREGRDRGTAVVQAAYERDVEDAFRALGPGALTRFHETTVPHGLPVLDLRRIDLPSG
jgi:hypothetical protein